MKDVPQRRVSVALHHTHCVGLPIHGLLAARLLIFLLLFCSNAGPKPKNEWFDPATLHQAKHP